MSKAHKQNGKGNTNDDPQRTHRNLFDQIGGVGRYTAPDPVRPKMNVRNTYVQPFALSTAALVNFAGAEQIYNLNSLFQPDLTGNNHQPYGFDQFIPTLFARYLTTDVDIELRVTSQANTKTLAVVFSIQPSNAVYSLLNQSLSQIAEKSMNGVMFLDSSGTTRVKHMHFPIHVIEGISATQHRAEMDDYSGSGSASPVKTPYLRIAAINLQDGTAATVNCVITLNYNSQLYQRAILGQS
jgi:hypothetical protein